MKLYIRAHDLGVKDIDPIAEKLVEYGLDGVQFVAYKALSDVKQSVGSFTSSHAEKVAKTLENVNKTIPLIYLIIKRQIQIHQPKAHFPQLPQSNHHTYLMNKLLYK